MSCRADEARPFPRYSGVLEGARTGCRRWVKFRRCARQLLEAWHDGPGAPPRLDGDLSLQGRRVPGSVTDLAVPPGTPAANTRRWLWHLDLGPRAPRATDPISMAAAGFPMSGYR